MTFAHPRKSDRSNVVVKWPFQVLPYTSSEVIQYCVNDEEWQKFRKILKGVPTFKKLEMLDMRRTQNITKNASKLETYVDRRCQVQLDNYINALRRGGQLNLKNEVIK